MEKERIDLTYIGTIQVIKHNLANTLENLIKMECHGKCENLSIAVDFIFYIFRTSVNRPYILQIQS